MRDNEPVLVQDGFQGVDNPLFLLGTVLDLFNGHRMDFRHHRLEQLREHPVPKALRILTQTIAAELDGGTLSVKAFD